MTAVRRFLGPLDAGRSFALRRLGPIAPRLLADREARVGVYGVFAVATAFLSTCFAPLAVLTVGPIVLGVPHLVADVRYLFVRTGLHRRAEVWVAVTGPVLAAGFSGYTVSGLLAPLGGAIVAQAAALKKGVALAVWGAVGLCVYLWPHAVQLAVAHGHNLLALAFFWAWRARQHRYHWVLVAAVFGGLALVGSGALDATVGHLVARLTSRSRLGFDSLVRELSPTHRPTLALRLVLAFAFLQSVHYAVWLRLIPEDDRARPGLRSFASSFRALEQDVGRSPIAVGCGAFAIFSAWALVDVGAARHAYLRVAGTHAYLEFAVFTLLLLEGRIPLRRAP